MATTISTSSTVGVRLTAASQNPVTITNTGAISTTSGYAIYGSNGTAWTLSNSGSVSGNQYGVTLRDGGTITNGSSGDTSAVISDGTVYHHRGEYYRAAIAISGARGTIDNDGTISGVSRPTALQQTSGAISLASGGIVVNGSPGIQGALIYGYGRGVVVSGTTRSAASTVVNYGSIVTGYFSSGAVVVEHGVVINGSPAVSSALIQGGVQGSYLTIFNDGTITKSFIAVSIGEDSRLVNGSASATSALITAGTDGIAVGEGGTAGTLSNDGTILQSGGADVPLGDGVQFQYGGTLTNGEIGVTTASIIGYAAGILVGREPNATSSAISNDGTVSATWRDGSGVILNSGGRLSNGEDGDTSAVISGSSSGLYAADYHQ